MTCCCGIIARKGKVCQAGFLVGFTLVRFSRNFSLTFARSCRRMLVDGFSETTVAGFLAGMYGRL